MQCTVPRALPKWSKFTCVVVTLSLAAVCILYSDDVSVFIDDTTSSAPEWNNLPLPLLIEETTLGVPQNVITDINNQIGYNPSETQAFQSNLANAASIINTTFANVQIESSSVAMNTTWEGNRSMRGTLGQYVIQYNYAGHQQALANVELALTKNRLYVAVADVYNWNHSPCAEETVDKVLSLSYSGNPFRQCTKVTDVASFMEGVINSLAKAMPAGMTNEFSPGAPPPFAVSFSVKAYMSECFGTDLPASFQLLRPPSYSVEAQYQSEVQPLRNSFYSSISPKVEAMVSGNWTYLDPLYAYSQNCLQQTLSYYSANPIAEPSDTQLQALVATYPDMNGIDLTDSFIKQLLISDFVLFSILLKLQSFASIRISDENDIKNSNSSTSLLQVSENPALSGVSESNKFLISSILTNMGYTKILVERATETRTWWTKFKDLFRKKSVNEKNEEKEARSWIKILSVFGKGGMSDGKYLQDILENLRNINEGFLRELRDSGITLDVSRDVQYSVNRIDTLQRVNDKLLESNIVSKTFKDVQDARKSDIEKYKSELSNVRIEENAVKSIMIFKNLRRAVKKRRIDLTRLLDDENKMAKKDKLRIVSLNNRRKPLFEYVNIPDLIKSTESQIPKIGDPEKEVKKSLRRVLSATENIVTVFDSPKLVHTGSNRKKFGKSVNEVYIANKMDSPIVATALAKLGVRMSRTGRMRSVFDALGLTADMSGFNEFYVIKEADESMESDAKEDVEEEKTNINEGRDSKKSNQEKEEEHKTEEY